MFTDYKLSHGETIVISDSNENIIDSVLIPNDITNTISMGRILMEMEIGVILKTHLQILKILKTHASQVSLMHQPRSSIWMVSNHTSNKRHFSPKYYYILYYKWRHS